jgi:hypothetical protein
MHKGHIRLTAPVLVLWLAGAATANGQILLTAETGGAGSHAIAVAANRIAPDDFDALGNFWAQYGYGLTKRVDVFAVYGNINVFGDTQHYGAIGANVNVLRSARSGIDVSLFGGVSTPITRRDEAAVVLGTFALIASRPTRLGSLTITPYGGIEMLVPAGHRARGIFTPIDTEYAGIVGMSVPVRGNWAAYVEYDPGLNLRSAGFGISVLVPPARPARP